MLVLGRRDGEGLWVGDDILIVVVLVEDEPRMAVSAPGHRISQTDSVITVVEEDIVVRCVGRQGSCIRIGIEAPQSVRIIREELETEEAWASFGSVRNARRIS